MVNMKIKTPLRNENVKTVKDKELTDKRSNSCEYFFSKEHLSILEQSVSDLRAHRNCHEHDLIESSAHRI